jgi:hypothetical protein
MAEVDMRTLSARKLEVAMASDLRFIRLGPTPAQYRQVRLAAAMHDYSMTAFAREAVLAAAAQPRSAEQVPGISAGTSPPPLDGCTRPEPAEKGIERLLGAVGVEYRSLPELGNLFLGYDDWRERYRTLLDRAGDLLVSRLVDVPGPICLLCAERRPEDCHRTLVAKYLASGSGAEIEHLLP